MKKIKIAAFVTAGLVFGLIVLGGVVRITNSGMGCGDDWPLCSGQVIPTLDNSAVWIEFGHRVFALLVSAMVLLTAILCWVNRTSVGVSGAGGPLRTAVMSAALLAVQVLLGAVTVWMELSPSVQPQR